MNFTREPIIETIISPRDGNKLLVRNSKGGSSEEYCIDAVEVVSFGHAFFFRSQERPKSFLVPVSDYEILEVKETRVALKNVSHERSIKIGGGRDASVRHNHPPREVEREPQESTEETPAVAEAGAVETATNESRMDKRRDRRGRHRRRRSSDDQEWTERKPQEQRREPDAARTSAGSEGGGAEDETKVSSSMFSSLFPPPPTLISETIGRYKDKEFSEGNAISKPVEEKKEKVEEKAEEKKENPPEPDHSGAEPSQFNRVLSTSSVDSSALSSTHFSSFGFDQF